MYYWDTNIFIFYILLYFSRRVRIFRIHNVLFRCSRAFHVSKISRERRKEIEKERTVPSTVYRLTKYGRATNDLSQSRLNPCRSGFRSPVGRMKSILARTPGDRLLPLIFSPSPPPKPDQYLTNRKISRAAIRNLNWSGSEIWMDGAEIDNGVALITIVQLYRSFSSLSNKTIRQLSLIPIHFPRFVIYVHNSYFAKIDRYDVVCRTCPIFPVKVGLNETFR